MICLSSTDIKVEKTGSTISQLAFSFCPHCFVLKEKNDFSLQMKLCQVKNLKVNCRHHYFYAKSYPAIVRVIIYLSTVYF